MQARRELFQALDLVPAQYTFKEAAAAVDVTSASSAAATAGSGVNAAPRDDAAGAVGSFQPLDGWSAGAKCSDQLGQPTIRGQVQPGSSRCGHSGQRAAAHTPYIVPEKCCCGSGTSHVCVCVCELFWPTIFQVPSVLG
jgi:hypothetical protein